MEFNINDSKFLNRARIIKLVNQGLCSCQGAAVSLGISQRQVQRIVRSFNEANQDISTLLAKPRNHWNRKGEEMRNLVVILKKERLSRSNYAIADLVKEQSGEKISPMTVKRILVGNNCYQKQKPERRTFKKFEAKRFGQILQMDTTEGCWLEGYRRTKLVLVLDDFSRAILGFKWTPHDTSWQNMLVLRSVILKYGLPVMIYTDNDSKFRTIRHGSIYFQYHKEQYQTEIHRALNDLGILLVNHPPYQAFCKGKIERLFRFIQERFLPETRAKNFNELNQEFRKWVRWYNQHHINRMTGVAPKKRFQPNGFKPLSGKEDLDWIFSIKESRKVDKYNSFSLDGIRYYLGNQDCLVGERVDLAINPTHKVRTYYQGKFIQEFRKKKSPHLPN